MEMDIYSLKRVSPKDLYRLPDREHYSIQSQRAFLRLVKDFVNKHKAQFVSVKDLASFFQCSPKTLFRILFPKQSEPDRKL